MGGRLIFSPNFYVHDFDCLEDITFFLDFMKRGEVVLKGNIK